MKVISFLSLLFISSNAIAQTVAPAPATAAAPTPAAAEPTQKFKFSCSRYQSKCLGKACDDMAAGVREDSEKKLLRFPNLEVLEYEIEPGNASESLIKGDVMALSARKYKATYKNVLITPSAITFVNKTPEGTEKDRLFIDPISGFYSYYILHTDGSIKEVPIGEPYKAYFGWCNKIDQLAKPADATLAPAEAQPVKPITVEPIATVPAVLPGDAK
jgi:hypothetical protein